MYLGKKKYFNMEEYEKRRAKCILFKNDAIDTAFSELEGLIDKEQIAGQYFEKSETWFSDKLNGCFLRRHKESFTEDECHSLAEAFRDIAKRLNAHADEIDAARYE